MKNSFFLVIPPQQSLPHRSKEFEAKALQSWLDELPTANPSLATRLLHDFLIDFNSLELPLTLRLDALETLRSTVLDIEEYLRSRLIRTGFPKEENDKKILSVLVSIEKEFTIGYWMVLRELTKRDLGWFQGKNAALAIQRCIKGLGNIVVSHFIMGVPVPDWVWIDLHSLYNLSITIKQSNTKVTNGQTQTNKSSSPEECYRQILMLSLSDPTGLMQKELLLVYHFIETINHLVGIRKEPVAGQAIQCLVLMDEDKAPHYQHEIKKADAATLYLDFNKLFKAFKQKAKLINVAEARFSSIHPLKNDNQKPSTELLDYLEQRWMGVDLQSVPLFSDRGDRYIAVGLEAAYELQSALGPISEKDLEIQVLSASDRLLFGFFEKSGLLSVGSLVSFRRIDSSGQKRALGIVNKIVVGKQNNGINFGMQLLAQRFMAINYLQMDDEGKELPQKGLFYHSKELDCEKSFLVTDSFMLKDGDIIRIFMNDDSFSAMLTSRRNVGLGYWQFECRRIAEKNKPVNTTQSKKGYDFI